MSADMLYLTLAALAFAIALNLKLTLAVLRSARRAAHPATPLQPGERLPDIDGTTLAGHARVRLAEPGQARALLFLSSRCPKCRDKVPAIGALAGAAREAGLALWIVSDEPRWRLRSLLRGTALAAHTARIGAHDYRLLNPTMASPAYLFVGHDGAIEAAGLIGDQHWRALERQLAGDAIEERAA
ncbi:hypothetical protein NM04_04815 [Massilia aurea]|uniref:Uncharacterized protein n=1 Tax=Massilia aurea TaxID=373040 RepID=A0A422QQ00_9BURK|nr:redoxin domain-containing protein [Massilia aurea]RNF31892.1 hypothetical protein NM04_04815 [Massilia aurea]